MLYSYPRAVVIICDSLETMKIAKHMFSAVHRNANLIVGSARAERAHLAADMGITEKVGTAASMPDLIDAHLNIIKVTADVDYYVKDIENMMMVTGQSGPRGDPFHVILMVEPLFEGDHMKRLKARKIYFYEARGAEADVNKMDYCDSVGDDFEIVGFQGSTVNVADHIKNIYNRWGFDV